ncbi:hypothetical protein AMECASPLE_025218 [Ameca splendens]|uniref:Uncharacterized protein n=1 Tax=Ameca splendens TaxID=208324 RepID=A0ABV0YRJ3_9TELE
MATSRRKKHCTASRFRERQQAASDRRFCIVWINRMVHKQVEKEIAELREEIVLMNFELRVQMAAELRKHLGKAVVTQMRETPEPYLASDAKEMETRHLKENEGKGKSLRKVEFNSNHSETKSSDMPYPNHISPKPDQSSRRFLSMSSKCDSVNGDIRHTKIKHLRGEDHSSSQQAQCGAISPSGDPAVCDNCKLTEKSDEKNSAKNPSQMSTVSEEESVGDKVEAEEHKLMKAQWEEWLDKQEMKGNQIHEHHRNVQQKAMGPSAPEEQITTRNKSGQMGTIKKITTYLSDFFSPSETSKWEILEEED